MGTANKLQYSEPMRFGYADPPYIGQAKKHYSHDPACAEVDHRELVARLVDQYPDGWALSLSSPSLQHILSLCPEKVRVMAWVKPFCAFKVNVNPAYAWEPVIVCGGRPRTRKQDTVRDWVSESITLQKGLHGAKPKAFCYWLFDVLNVQPGDCLDDIFPGTGIVGRCFDEYTSKTTIADSPLFQFDERSLMAVEDLERQGYHFNEIQVGDKLLRIPLCSSTAKSEEGTHE